MMTVSSQQKTLGSFILIIVLAFGVVYVIEGFWESKRGVLPAGSGDWRVLFQGPLSLGNAGNRTGFGSPQRPTDLLRAGTPDKDSADVRRGLCVAAMTGDTARVKFFLDQGVHPDARDEFGIRALARAVLWGHFDAVLLLLEAGADINAREMFGVTPLMLAVNEGDEGIAAMLLAKGADLEAVSEDGETAFSIARKKRNKQILKILGNPDLWTVGPQKKKPRPSALHPEKSPEPSPMAVAKPEHPKIPADPVTLSRVDALTWAEDISRESMKTGEVEKIQVYFEDDREAFLVPGEGPDSVRPQTAFSSGAAPLPPFSDQNTAALHGPASPGEMIFRVKPPEPEIVRSTQPVSSPEILTVPVSLPENQALIDAALAGDKARVSRLLSAGAAVDTRGDFGMTALMIAAQAGDVRMVDLLVAHGADIDATNLFGQTALKLARLRERSQVIRVLEQPAGWVRGGADG